MMSHKLLAPKSPQFVFVEIFLLGEAPVLSKYLLIPLHAIEAYSFDNDALY